MRRRTLPTVRDERGVLVAVEAATLDFVPRRLFIVSEVPADAVRGDHRVPCRQTMALCSGRAEVELWDARHEPLGVFGLHEPGDAVDLFADDFVRYRLSGPGASVVVFAAEPYRGLTTDPAGTSS